jgi:hypothetical protein
VSDQPVCTIRDPGPYAFIVLRMQQKLAESTERHAVALDLFSTYTNPSGPPMPSAKEATLLALNATIGLLVLAEECARSASICVLNDADGQAVVEWLATANSNMQRYYYATRGAKLFDDWLPILLPFQRIRRFCGSLYIGLVSEYCVAYTRELMALSLEIKNRSQVRVSL